MISLLEQMGLQTPFTLQDFKLQGTKIRDGVVLSRYSRNKWFANDLSIFLASGQLAL